MIGQTWSARYTRVWLVLIAITALSWWTGHAIGNQRLAGALVLMLAFLKARFVISDFMEVRDAPIALRLLTDGWVVLAGALLVILSLR